MNFEEEMEEHQRFLLLHPSAKVHSRPMIGSGVNITFINEGFFEERATAERIKACLERIKEEPLAIRQIAMDFGELKKNPMQLAIDL